MIPFETFCRIKSLSQQEGLTIGQIAGELGIDQRTVVKSLQQKNYQPRQTVPRSSKLDPYKPLIKQLLAAHDYTAIQIFQRVHCLLYTSDAADE